ncbi:cell surface protein [Myxococcota bacterium]|nr:cell surface protein [Myxococcota bacterium]
MKNKVQGLQERCWHSMMRCYRRWPRCFGLVAILGVLWGLGGAACVGGVAQESVAGDAAEWGAEAGAEQQAWKAKELTAWEGSDLDAGIPEGYVWGEAGGGFAQGVVSFSPTGGVSYGQEDFPNKLLGPPQGSGLGKGSLDVVSLGCGGEIILEFSDPMIGDGPGPDFIVFENAFSPNGVGSFAEPAEVSVSVDGKNWRVFPCDPQSASWPYAQCAGVRPVFSSPENRISPYDPQVSGGDVYDLRDLGVSVARFVRIRDRSRALPDAARWCQAHNAGFDLDAISVIWPYRPKP